MVKTADAPPAAAEQKHTVNDIRVFRAVFRGMPLGENQLLVKVSADFPVELRRTPGDLTKWRAFEQRTGQAYGFPKAPLPKIMEKVRGLYLRVVQDWQAFGRDGEAIDRAVWKSDVPF